MTKRQKALGVTEYGYRRGIVLGEYLADYEAFAAKAATLRKGQTSAEAICKAWQGEVVSVWVDQIKRYLRALTINDSEHYQYTDTLGLDVLNVM